MGHSVIHIGANKTASTTLQRSLFGRNPALQYLGEGGEGYNNYAPILNALVNDDDLFYPAAECEALFRRHAALAEKRTFLFSNEDIMTSRVPLLCAERLRGLMPGAEVLLVMRNQQNAIPSFYANHGAFLKPAPPSYFRRHVAFDDWIAFQTMFSKYGPLASFRYDQFESIYSGLFGGRVHILLFEEFVNNRRAFVEKLCVILKLDPDVALQSLQSSHERRRFTGRRLAFNRFRTTFFWGIQVSNYLPFGGALVRMFDDFLAGGAPARIEVSDNIRKTIHDLYCDGNSRLAEKYKLPLAYYGYPMVSAGG